MALPKDIRDRLSLPAVCAPMTAATGPKLVSEALKAGLMAGLPPSNAGSFEGFEAWMVEIEEDLKRFAERHPDRPIGPFALNLRMSKSEEELQREMKVAARLGVKVFISAKGNPREMAKRVHDYGGLLFHDVVNMRHAEKAIEAGVDGLTCIGAGGGGSSGPISHLVLIPKIRSMFDGVIVMAGAVTNGAAIRAGEILGADLSYLGTRFIATQESIAHPEYKQMLTTETSDKLMWTENLNKVPSFWLVASLLRKGLDPANLPMAKGFADYSHLPADAKPWWDLWSAGQGIDLIDDIPTVAELVARLKREYVAACRAPSMEAEASRLVDQALATA